MSSEDDRSKAPSAGAAAPQRGGRNAPPADDKGATPHDASPPAANRPRSDRQSSHEPGDAAAAAGTVDRPVAPGDAQAGDRSEAGANLGGPVDVFPLRDRARKERPPG